MRSTRRYIAAAALLVVGLTASVPTPARADSPTDSALEIARACAEKRFSDVGALLHSSLRRTWIEIDYPVRAWCETVTRGYTLREVRIDKEERVGVHALVYLTWIFGDGSEQSDRETFLEEAGRWKLAG